MPPLLSIIIPSYEPGRFLIPALDSVLSQDLDCEIIVHDGGSGPATQEILAQYSADVECYSEPDAGQADALNRALGKVSGEIIGWLNADDLYTEGALRQVVRAFTEDPTLDVVFGDFSLIDSEGRQLRYYDVSPWDWRRFYQRGCYIFSGATFFRRSVFQEYGDFRVDLHYCMDLEFFLRIGRGVKAKKVAGLLGSLRVHPGSKTVSTPFPFIREAYAVRKSYASGSYDIVSALWAGARNAVLIAAQPIRFSGAWSTVRPRRSL